jgi:hypothetical protein
MTNNVNNNYIFSAYMQSTNGGAWVPETGTGATQLIQLYMAFSKLQVPQIEIAPGNPVDFYQLVTYVAARHRQ